MPKSHAQVSGLPVDRSAKVTVSGAAPDVTGVAEMAATGGPGRAEPTVIMRVVNVIPPAFETVSFAVYVPADE